MIYCDRYIKRVKKNLEIAHEILLIFVAFINFTVLKLYKNRINCKTYSNILK